MMFPSFILKKEWADCRLQTQASRLSLLRAEEGRKGEKKKQSWAQSEFRHPDRLKAERVRCHLMIVGVHDEVSPARAWGRRFHCWDRSANPLAYSRGRTVPRLPQVPPSCASVVRPESSGDALKSLWNDLESGGLQLKKKVTAQPVILNVKGRWDVQFLGRTRCQMRSLERVGKRSRNLHQGRVAQHSLFLFLVTVLFIFLFIYLFICRCDIALESTPDRCDRGCFIILNMF